jgi:hypothetical protein
MLSATRQARREAVACTRLILIEAPSSTYHRGMLVLGKYTERRRPSMLALMSSFFSRLSGRGDLSP